MRTFDELESLWGEVELRRGTGRVDAITLRKGNEQHDADGTLEPSGPVPPGPPGY